MLGQLSEGERRLFRFQPSDRLHALLSLLSILWSEPRRLRSKGRGKEPHAQAHLVRSGATNPDKHPGAGGQPPADDNACA